MRNVALKVAALLVGLAVLPVLHAKVAHDDPIGELARLWALWQPQLDAYVARALAPGYGVPGEA